MRLTVSVRIERRRVVAALVAVAALGAGDLAYAQEGSQTPENAHLFLRQLAAMNNATIQVPNPRWEQHGGGHYSWDPTPLGHIVESSGCTTRFNTSQVAHEGPGSYGGTFTRHYAAGYNQLSNPGIVWSQVSEVRQQGAIIYLMGLPPGTFELRLPSESLAARTAYALEVIRLSCDRLGASGF